MQTYPTSHRAWRVCVAFLNCALLATFLVGCAAMDPNHVLTRNIGNGAPADGAALDTRTRQQAYDFVWTRINDAYVDPKFNGVDWAQAGALHKDKILTAANDDVFWKSLDGMVAELGDAHTRVLSPRQYAFYKDKQSLTLGLSLAELEGDIVVMSVEKESPADKAGIQKGNRLLSIEARPALEWWKAQFDKARKNSSDRARLKTVKRVLNSGDPEAPSDTLSLQIERNDGSVFQTHLTRLVLPRKDTLTGTVLESGFGYIRLTGFDPKLGGEIAPVFRTVQGTKGLIVDLRGNGGGSLGLSINLMNQLVQGRVPVGKRITRTGKPPTLFLGLLTLGKMDLELVGVSKPFLGPVVVLVDGDSASGSEFFSGSLQAINRAQVVGETTCGCLLGYMGYANVPGGGALAYSELDFAPVRGPRIEGLGVQPDYVITPSRKDLIDGKDRALAQAIQVLEKALPQSPSQAER
jgi:carboxyl-terminal processing protease